MLTVIFYIFMYFVIGFGFAKFKKYYDELYSPEKISIVNYPMLGMVWLPYSVGMLCISVVAFVYEIYKAKL